MLIFREFESLLKFENPPDLIYAATVPMEYWRRSRLSNSKRFGNEFNHFKSSLGACYVVWRNNDGINYDNLSILVSRLRISKRSKTHW